MKLFKTLVIATAFIFSHANAENLSIATGGTGGVYYPMGGGLASVLSKYIPGMSATAEVTGGSVDNLNLIGTGKPYVGFVMADAAKDAQVGEGKFTGKKIELRTLLILYPNLMHVATVESTGIKSMGDLKGKRVSTGSPGSATEVMAFRELEAAGLDKDKDVKRERLSVAESVNAIKDRKIDAYFPTVIPKSTYSGMAKDNKVSAVANILVVNANMPDDQAYKIIQAIFDHKIDLVRTHQEYINVLLENQKSKSSPVAFHPGALKYFKEHNVKIN